MPDQEHLIQIHERLKGVETTLTESRDDTRELIEYLRGNGQPGIIPKLDDRVTGLETRWESSKSWLRGAAWVIAGILTLTGTALAVYELIW